MPDMTPVLECIFSHAQVAKKNILVTMLIVSIYKRVGQVSLFKDPTQCREEIRDSFQGRSGTSCGGLYNLPGGRPALLIASGMCPWKIIVPVFLFIKILCLACEFSKLAFLTV